MVNRVLTGSVASLYGVLLGGSSTAYVYSEDDNVNFRYKETTGSENWANIRDIVSGLNDLRSSFQDGCNSIQNACSQNGVTPASNSPADISSAINQIASNKYNAGFNAGQQAAAVSFTQTRASQISFYNPGYHYFDISASESGYDYLIVSGWFSGRITSVEVSNSATKVLASKILSTGDGTNTMVHCILQKPANSCRVKFNHSGSGNGYVIVYGAK